MRVTIMGYGKMGKMVEEVCQDQGHEIAHTIDIDNLPSKAGFSGEWVEKTDALIPPYFPRPRNSPWWWSQKRTGPSLAGTSGNTEE